MEESTWTKVAEESRLQEGVPVLVESGEDKILLVRLEGKIHAVGHECPHYQEKLENGVLFGRELVCKSHFARLDVTTGKTTAPPAGMLSRQVAVSVATVVPALLMTVVTGTPAACGRVPKFWIFTDTIWESLAQVD